MQAIHSGDDVTYVLLFSLVPWFAIPATHVDTYTIRCEPLDIATNIFASASTDVVKKMLVYDLDAHS